MGSEQSLRVITMPGTLSEQHDERDWLRIQLSKASAKIEALSAEKTDALRDAENARAEARRFRQLHNKAVSDGESVAASLRQQVQTLKERQDEKDSLHSKEVRRLKNALEELQVSVESRERHAADAAKKMRQDH